MEISRQKTVNRAVTTKPAAAFQMQTSKVSSPHDPAEKEASATAKRVMQRVVPESSVAYVPVGEGGFFAKSSGIHRYSAKGIFAKHKNEHLEINRKAEGPPDVSSNVSAELQSSEISGTPLPLSVRKFMEPRFNADFSKVRIETGDKAAVMNRQVGAQAFTVGNQIYFGKDRFQPETHEGKELIAHELTHTIQQGATIQRSEDPTVTQHSPVHIQRWGIIDEALDYIADKANMIPGFRMFTIVLGVNPINMSKVDRSAANILRALVEFMPGGGLIVKALDNHGVFDKVGNWVEQQVRALGLVGSSIKQALMDFVKSLGIKDAANLSGVWNRAKRIFTEPIDQIINLAKSVVSGIVQFIKDAILRPIAKLAEGTRGYDLLKAVLGKDPITGDAIPQTADTLIAGFMKLIGQEDVWNNMKKANAVPRAFAWFKGAMNQLMAFIREIPSLFMKAFKSLEIADIILLPNAFAKLASVFGGFIGNFFSWAANAVWNLLEIIFDVVSPGALGYIKKTGSALKSILKNPLPFVGNLVKAAKLGFTNFAANFGTHLKAGLIDWLTGSLPGIYIPKAFSLAEIVKFVFSVLGLTWQNIRQKLVKVVGEPAVKAMETGFNIVVTLVTQGPAAAWEQIKEQLADLKDMVIGGIQDFVIDMVVKKAVPKLIAMFIPGAGFISAILSIYDTVMVFVNKISKIIQVVTGFINSITAIAAGAIGAAASKVETTLAGLLALGINFLAGFIGLGKVADKVMGVIQKVRAPIDKALDWLINWIVTLARKLGKFIAQAGVPQDPNERLKLGKQAALAAVNRFAGKPAAEAVLTPLLSVIKTRYCFVRLDVIPRQGKWHLIGEVNPKFDEATKTLLPGAMVPPEGGQTLLVGEGNFTFALSIAGKTQIGGSLLATDYMVNERQTLEKTATEERRNAAVQANIAKLESIGVQVIRQVDAIDPASYPSGEFDIVAFNHPLVLTKDEENKTVRGGEKANIELIEGFLAAAKQKIKSGGSIIIISSRFRLQRWKLDEMAERLQLEQAVMKFVAKKFPGYKHEKTMKGESAKTVQSRDQFVVIFTIKAGIQG